MYEDDFIMLFRKETKQTLTKPKRFTNGQIWFNGFVCGAVFELAILIIWLSFLDK